MHPAAALILTGGRSRRFGSHKPSARYAGRPLVHYALAATAAYPRLVVGEPIDVDPGIPVIREDPPGGGPVAAIAAGRAALPASSSIVVLAADLPLITAAHIERLLRQTTDRPAVYLDRDGRPQWLCAAWPAEVLRARLAAIGDPNGVSMRTLTDLPFNGVPDPDGAAGTDIDTPHDLAALTEGPG